MSGLSLADLFLVGLVLDISGAVLLARGLLLSPRELSRLNTMWGAGAGVHEDRIRNRVAGEFGVAYLAGGFVLQFIGYGLDIGGVSTTVGTDRLILALGMVAASAILIWGAWALLRGRRIEALTQATDRAYPAVRDEINAMDEATDQPKPQDADEARRD